MLTTRSNFISRISKRLASVLAISLVAASMSACGGGGANTSVVVNTPGVALYTSAPASVTLALGASAVYTIGGGGGTSKFTTYTATSSNPDILTVTLNVDSMIITGNKSGSVTVSVKDSVGGSVSIPVTVGISTALAIQAPASVTLVNGIQTNYKITGGTQPYTVVSSNIGVVSAVIASAGDTLSLTGVGTGGAQIVVYDAKLASTTVATVVAQNGSPSQLFTTAPSIISLSVGGVIPSYQIGGGTPPYTITSNSPDIFEASLAGSAFTIRGKALGFGLVAVKDAVGSSVNVNVSIVSGSVTVPFYTTAPSSVVLKTGDVVNYALAGGTPPYSLVTSNQSVVGVSVTQATGAITFNGIAPGFATVLARDSVGAVSSIAVTVASSTTVQPPVALFTSSPSDIVLQAGTTSNFTIGGGSGGYTVSASNLAVTAVAMVDNSTFSITSNNVGTSTVFLKDSSGGAVKINVTVANPRTSPIDLYTTAPSTLVAKSGSTYRFAVQGGTGPYTVTSSNPSSSLVAISGSVLLISGAVPGTSNVFVKDANGATVVIVVTVS
ncbi:hypothetical protein QN372_20765 [Undibacterium sp. RTI2.1]|uniref:hypothetical protein n=1 Tax=unclassified Undibacterium TaxID=2630295 RepID=UPI002B227EE1|nr:MULTISPECIES: hypothetical protein [unclassified Undibacterium]MEB0033174.1 hypothetical protein [Undibacterium sp. RTI2.1]MEB0118732.1 hypothetical protein [Undibacterium sp. RTI2.2]